jgi:hypothetical protein
MAGFLVDETDLPFAEKVIYVSDRELFFLLFPDARVMEQGRVLGRNEARPATDKYK